MPYGPQFRKHSVQPILKRLRFGSICLIIKWNRFGKASIAFMKWFVRENLLLSLCGLNCGLCQMQLGGYCPGCGGGPGNQSCRIARCAMEHGHVAYCWQCAQYPCAEYTAWDTGDSFVIRRNRAKDAERASSDLAAYMLELNERMVVLKALLDGYNDGRRKRFFVACVSLLPISELREAVSLLNEDESLMQKPVADRAAHAALIFRQMAAKSGVELRFRQK